MLEYSMVWECADGVDRRGRVVSDDPDALERPRVGEVLEYWDGSAVVVTGFHIDFREVSEWTPDFLLKGTTKFEWAYFLDNGIFSAVRDPEGILDYLTYLFRLSLADQVASAIEEHR